MYLKKLELINYRNYEDCFIEFPSIKTIFIGDNAQGKTNILEAVYYLANLSSYRSKSDKDLVLWGKDFSRVKCLLNKFDTDIELDVWINPSKKKTLKVNGIKKTSYSEFLNNISVVKFGVDDLLLLRGAPSDRRKWLDTAISQIYPAYNDRLTKFNKIRNQRNNLLKNFSGNINISSFQEESISIWDDQLIVTGSNIIYLRQKYLKEIYNTSVQKHKVISNKGEELSFCYNSTIIDEFSATDDLIPVEKIAEIYGNKLKEKRAEEIIRAQTVIGPHRDDVKFFINDIDTDSFASQGQQRTVVLALKLAELDLIKEKTGESPILLLDDVLAELDSIRQNYLLDSIGDNIQTIITSTDINNFKPEFLEGVSVYSIKEGKVIS